MNNLRYCTSVDRKLGHAELFIIHGKENRIRMDTVISLTCDIVIEALRMRHEVYFVCLDMQAPERLPDKFHRRNSHFGKSKHDSFHTVGRPDILKKSECSLQIKSKETSRSVDKTVYMRILAPQSLAEQIPYQNTLTRISRCKSILAEKPLSRTVSLGKCHRNDILLRTRNQ